MKITKRQLKKIISESAGFAPMKSRATPEIKAAVSNSYRQEQLNESNRIQKEVELMTQIDQIASSIEEIAGGIWGMSGPGTVDGSAGDELAQDLELQVERLNDFYGLLVAHFESTDSENQSNPSDPRGNRQR